MSSTENNSFNKNLYMEFVYISLILGALSALAIHFLPQATIIISMSFFVICLPVHMFHYWLFIASIERKQWTQEEKRSAIAFSKGPKWVSIATTAALITLATIAKMMLIAR